MAAPRSDLEIVTILPTAEKVRLLTGADSWRTHGEPGIGLRPMLTSDGPAGVRGMSRDERRPSASLPCPSAVGATWDAELVQRLATALGTEARSKGVDILLAPTVNLMRTPLGGRGFEFFAEDPVLTARLAIAYVRGGQRTGVAATVKHYVGNDSETDRWTYDAQISETALRELYLVPFEACVREAGAWLIMAAYNKVNGSRMTENLRLLRGVLKNEWGFDGVVISDWHAARSTHATAVATLDLSMPGPEGPWGDLLTEATADGTISEQLLNDKVVRLLRLARRVGALTLSADGVTVIDSITPVPDDPVEAMTRPGLLRAALWLQAETDTELRLEFRPAADGAGPLTFRLGLVPAAEDETLLAEAAAEGADAAIVVVGSAELTESEGFDRSTLSLPGRQDELVRRIAAVNSNTVVVVNSGMPVLMPWAGQVVAIIYAWLPGQSFGDALTDVLLGAAEPGGRLPVTLPAAEADCPVLHAAPGTGGALRYAEGLLIGYRGYDAAGTQPRYPFGHGLGYTSWAYESLGCPAAVAEGEDLDVVVTIRNTGQRPGKEVVQAYLAGPGRPADRGRPVRALAAFTVVRAAPGEAAAARLTIPARAFARYDEDLGSWIWPGGVFTVHAGRSSRDLPLRAPVRCRAGGAPGA